MKTRIFYGNQHISSFTTRGQYLKYFARKVIVGTIAIMAIYTFGYVFFLVGAVFSPVTVHAEPTTITKEVPRKAPVMDRIADCESGDRKNGRPVKGTARHLDPSTHQVYTKANTNKTVDIGKYMINEHYHGKAASTLGLDLTVEADNEKMAYHLYETQGTAPWSASASCWVI